MKSFSDKIKPKHTSGKRGIKEVQKFKRSIRSRAVEDSELKRDRIYGWREGGSRYPYTLIQRFLKSRVGRSWTSVTEEINRKVKDPSIRNDFFSCVLRTFHGSDGVLYTIDRGWTRRVDEINCFYILDDILCYSNNRGRYRYKQTPSAYSLKGFVYIQENGIWYRFADEPDTDTDTDTSRSYTRTYSVKQLDTSKIVKVSYHVYTIQSKKQLSKKELKIVEQFS